MKMKSSNLDGFLQPSYSPNCASVSFFNRSGVARTCCGVCRDRGSACYPCGLNQHRDLGHQAPATGYILTPLHSAREAIHHSILFSLSSGQWVGRYVRAAFPPFSNSLVCARSYSFQPSLYLHTTYYYLSTYPPSHHLSHYHNSDYSSSLFSINKLRLLRGFSLFEKERRTCSEESGRRQLRSDMR